MNFVVKNTMKWGWIDLVCPHSCRGCGRLGSVLCDCCKNDILKQHKAICPLCKRELGVDEADKCKECEVGLEAIFVGGWREGALAKLVAEYKYKSVRAAGEVLAEVLDNAIEKDWMKNKEVIIVPLPTIGRHVRERGIDHTFILAKKLAKRRGWKMERILERAVDTVQVGAKAAERQEQAKKAYVAVGKVQKDKTYLLLDDVWTTGASMLAAVNVIREAGAEKVGVVVIEVGK